jgi:hypothetical protein
MAKLLRTRAWIILLAVLSPWLLVSMAVVVVLMAINLILFLGFVWFVTAFDRPARPLPPFLPS